MGELRFGVRSVPPAGIEPATHGLGNHVSAVMECDWETFPLVVAPSVYRWKTSEKRCWPQDGHNDVCATA
jgi:hypothetical protein